MNLHCLPCAQFLLLHSWYHPDHLAIHTGDEIDEKLMDSSAPLGGHALGWIHLPRGGKGRESCLNKARTFKSQQIWTWIWHGYWLMDLEGVIDIQCVWHASFARWDAEIWFHLARKKEKRSTIPVGLPWHAVSSLVGHLQVGPSCPLWPIIWNLPLHTRSWLWLLRVLHGPNNQPFSASKPDGCERGSHGNLGLGWTWIGIRPLIDRSNLIEPLETLWKYLNPCNIVSGFGLRKQLVHFNWSVQMDCYWTVRIPKFE